MALKWEANYRKRFSGEKSVAMCFNAEQDDVDKDIFLNIEQINLQGSTILDIGSGTGEQAIYLAQKGFQVTGIDISASAIEYARKFAQDSMVNVCFKVDNILASDLDGQFEIVIDRGLYELIAFENLEIYLATVKRLIKPGGWYILKTARLKRKIDAVKATSGLNIVKFEDTEYRTLDNRTVKAWILVAQKTLF